MERARGPTEQVFYKVRQLRPFNITITARVSGPVTEARVREALPALQSRHPLLQANILAESPPRFSRASVPELPLEVVPREQEGSWLQQVDKQINLPFDASRGPLARFVLVRGGSHSELICGYDHLIGDALSGCFVLRERLRVMAPGGERPPELQSRPAYEDLIGPPSRAPECSTRWSPGVRPRSCACLRRSTGCRPGSTPFLPWSPPPRRSARASSTAGWRPPRRSGCCPSAASGNPPCTGSWAPRCCWCAATRVPLRARGLGRPNLLRALARRRTVVWLASVYTSWQARPSLVDPLPYLAGAERSQHQRGDT